MAQMNFYTDVEVNVDYDDFLEACSEKEIEKIAKWLEKNDYLLNSKKVSSNTQDEIWDRSISKLIGNRWKLSKEDEETIKKIVNNIIE